MTPAARPHSGPPSPVGAAPAAAATPRRLPGGTGVLDVMITDDDPLDRVEAKAALLAGSSARFAFREHDTGETTIADCAARPPDVLVLDFALGDMDAIELLGRLPHDPPGTPVVPVVVLTGSVDAAASGRILRAGAMDFVGKDWLTPASLTRAIENARERHAMLREQAARAAELARSEAGLRLALTATSTGLWTWHVAEDRVEWSPEVPSVCGVTDAQRPADAAAFLALVDPDDRRRVARVLRTAVDTRAPFEVEYRLARPDGSLLWVENRGRCLGGDDGAPLRLFGTVTDVSRRKAMEQALRDADRRKDEFLAVLAHELRNPLAPIRTSVGILAARGAGDPLIARCRDVIDRQTGQMARLLDDLLDVSRLSRGQVSLRRAPVALADVLDAAVETARPGIEAAGQRLRLPSGGELAVRLDADGARLTQVFANVLHNASKYSPPGSRIDVSVHRIGRDAVSVEVRDEGIGVPVDMLDKVFDLFVQTRDARRHAPGGLGIGLSLARQIVELHGGRITVLSAGDGHGSAFRVELPVADGDGAPATATAPAADAAPLLRRVLVADDNADHADVTAMLLRELGCEVRTAYDGGEALRVATDWHPDVALLDLGMPVLDGHAVCRALRDLPWGAAVRVIAVSGWGQEADRARTRAAGFDLHLVKPVGPQQLVAAVGATPPSPD